MAKGANRDDYKGMKGSGKDPSRHFPKKSPSPGGKDMALSAPRDEETLPGFKCKSKGGMGKRSG